MTGGAAGDDPKADIEALAKRLYRPLMDRLRAEIKLDRERYGMAAR